MGVSDGVMETLTASAVSQGFEAQERSKTAEAVGGVSLRLTTPLKRGVNEICHQV